LKAIASPAREIGENRSMPPNDFIPGLNHLVEINKDAEDGFSSAAQNVRNSELETLFAGYAKQHAKFAAELRQEIDRLGGRPTTSGTFGGALHRNWMDLKSVLSGHSAAAILASCESGEQSAIAAYTEAADANATGRIRSLIEKHLQQIQGFHTRLCRLVGETKDGIEFPHNE
jgi:uncharacterized protein (TIGR02284 family)